MKKQLLLILTLSLNVWADPLGRLRVSTTVNDKFENFTLKIENRSSKDVFCEEMSFEVIYIDPETYVEVAQELIPVNNFYSRKQGETQSSSMLLASRETISLRKSYPSAVIKSVRLYNELTNCEDADFETFALYAPKSKADLLTLSEIRNSFHGREYFEIQDRIPQIDSLNLSKRNILSLKPLEFFWDLDVLDIADNPLSDLSPLQSLRELRVLDISRTNVKTLAPLMPRENKLKVRAKGVQLKDPSELEKFKKAIWVITYN